jgi:hemerythrin-like domain-containing protein
MQSSPSQRVEAAFVARPQPYRYIHKALRAEMSSCLSRLGQADPGDPVSMVAALDAVEELLQLIESHLQLEDEFFHPPLRQRAPELIERFDLDHEEHHQGMRELRRAIEAARPGAPRNDAHHYSLYLQLSRWITHQFEHMFAEETELSAALWQHFSDEEILAIEQRLVASIPAAKARSVMLKMLAALTHAERVDWLGPMAANMPAEAFGDVMLLAAQALSAADLLKLTRALDLPSALGRRVA